MCESSLILLLNSLRVAAGLFSNEYYALNLELVSKFCFNVIHVIHVFIQAGTEQRNITTEILYFCTLQFQIKFKESIQSSNKGLFCVWFSVNSCKEKLYSPIYPSLIASSRNSWIAISRQL